MVSDILADALEEVRAYRTSREMGRAYLPYAPQLDAWEKLTEELVSSLDAPPRPSGAPGGEQGG